MNPRYDYSDQRIASWIWWYYRKERNRLFPMSKGGLDSPLTDVEMNMVWDHVRFLVHDRFPGEDESRLADVLNRVRQLSLERLAPISALTGRSLDEIAASAARNPRLTNRRRKR